MIMKFMKLRWKCCLQKSVLAYCRVSVIQYGFTTDSISKLKRSALRTVELSFAIKRLFENIDVICGELHKITRNQIRWHNDIVVNLISVQLQFRYASINLLYTFITNTVSSSMDKIYKILTTRYMMSILSLCVLGSIFYLSMQCILYLEQYLGFFRNVLNHCFRLITCSLTKITRVV